MPGLGIRLGLFSTITTDPVLNDYTITAETGSFTLSGQSVDLLVGPLITSIENSLGSAIGDTAGGYTISVLGSNLTGVSSVTIGGVSATDVTVVDDTEVTCTVPDLSTTGLKTVTATNSNGTGTLTNGFRAWDPSAATWTGGWQEDKVTSGSNVTEWSDMFGTTNSDFTAAISHPTVGATLNGQPTNDHSSGRKFVSASTLDALFDQTSWFLAAVVVLDSTANGNGIFDDASSFITIDINSSNIRLRQWDGSYKTSTSTHSLSTGTPYLIMARQDGTTQYVSVNNTNEDSDSCNGYTGTGVLQVGSGLDGRIAMMLAADTVPSATIRGYIHAYVATRFGVGS